MPTYQDNIGGFGRTSPVEPATVTSVTDESQAKRQRALYIREAALGCTDSVTLTLIEMAEGLEAEAAAMEGEVNRPWIPHIPL